MFKPKFSRRKNTDGIELDEGEMPSAAKETKLYSVRISHQGIVSRSNRYYPADAVEFSAQIDRLLQRTQQQHPP